MFLYTSSHPTPANVHSCHCFKSKFLRTCQVHPTGLYKVIFVPHSEFCSDTHWSGKALLTDTDRGKKQSWVISAWASTGRRESSSWQAVLSLWLETVPRHDTTEPVLNFFQLLSTVIRDSSLTVQPKIIQIILTLIKVLDKNKWTKSCSLPPRVLQDAKTSLHKRRL